MELLSHKLKIDENLDNTMLIIFITLKLKEQRKNSQKKNTLAYKDS
jgi:hypothetical protein